MGCCGSVLKTGTLRRTLGGLQFVPYNELFEFSPPKPPSCPKSDIFRAKRYSDIKEHATETPLPLAALEGGFHALAYYLSQPATDAIGKVWAIYSWLINFDPETLQEGDEVLPDNTAVEYLMKLQHKRSPHPQLFAALVQALDIPCVIIKGISKNSAYQFGLDIDRSQMTSLWNAVYVENEWRLVDTFWGSLSVTGKRTRDWAIVNVDGEVITAREKASSGSRSRFSNDFYFFTDPDKFICTHFPDDPSWQLLERPITEDIFISQVYVRERYFEMDCSLEDKSSCILHASGGHQLLEFGLPRDRSANYEFKYLLFKDSKQCRMVRNETLQGIVFSEMKATTLSYSIQFPTRGRFRFDVFGAEKYVHEKYDLVASYVIISDVASSEFEILPDSPEIGWGPGKETKRAGLIPVTHDCSIVDLTDGNCQIKFRMTKQAMFEIELKNNDTKPWNLENHALLSLENRELEIDLRLPRKGQYALKIYAKQGNDPGKLRNVCNYLVKNEGSEEGPSSFPFIHNNTTGSNVHICKHFGVLPTNLTSSVVCSKSEQTFEFLIQRGDVTLVGLLSGAGLQDIEMSDIVSKKLGKKSVEFKISFETLEYGEYSFNVFVRHTHSQILYSAHTYVVLYQSEAMDSAELAGSNMLPSVKTYKLIDENVKVKHAVENKTSLVYACVEKCFHRYSPDGALASQISVSCSGQAVELAAGKVDTDAPFRIDWYEETYQGSGCIVGKTRSRLAPEINVHEAAIRARLKMNLVLKNLQFALAALQWCERLEFKDKILVPRVQVMAKYLQKKKDVIEQLRDAAHNVKTSKFHKLLKPAETLLKQSHADKDLRKHIVIARERLMKKLQKKIRKINHTTVADIKSYNCPPSSVVPVMQATLLLLGHPLADITDWVAIRSVISDTQRINHELKHAKVDQISPADVSEARRLISHIHPHHVRHASGVVNHFYNWCQNVIGLSQYIH